MADVPRSTETRLADAPEVRPVSRPASGRAAVADGPMPGRMADRRSGANVAPSAGIVGDGRTVDSPAVSGAATSFRVLGNQVQVFYSIGLILIYSLLDGSLLGSSLNGPKVETAKLLTDSERRKIQVVKAQLENGENPFSEVAKNTLGGGEFHSLPKLEPTEKQELAAIEVRRSRFENKKGKFKGATTWTEDSNGDLVVKTRQHTTAVYSVSEPNSVLCVLCQAVINVFTAVYCRCQLGQSIKRWTEEVQVFNAATKLVTTEVIERSEIIPKLIKGDVCSSCFDEKWKDTYRAMDGTLKRVLEPIERKDAGRKEEVNGQLRSVIPSFQGDIKADKGSPLSVKATQVFKNPDGSEDELVLGRKTFKSPKAQKRQRLAENEPSPQGFAYFRKGRA